MLSVVWSTVQPMLESYILITLLLSVCFVTPVVYSITTMMEFPAAKKPVLIPTAHLVIRLLFVELLTLVPVQIPLLQINTTLEPHAPLKTALSQQLLTALLSMQHPVMELSKDIMGSPVIPALKPVPQISL